MLQTVKSSFLFIIIFTMFSAVFAVDNNADTKQPETIIHKAGIQVKSTETSVKVAHLKNGTWRMSNEATSLLTT